MEFVKKIRLEAMLNPVRNLEACTMLIEIAGEALAILEEASTDDLDGERLDIGDHKYALQESFNRLWKATD